MLWGCGKGSGVGASAPLASTTAKGTDPSIASGTDSGIQLPDLTGHTLVTYCGVGTARPFQEITDAFRSRTGCGMNVTYVNVGQIQSQITTSEEGDPFIAESENELKPVESYVEGKKELVKHMPVLVVQSGSPKNIMEPADLTGGRVTLIMGDVDSTPIGKIAKKAMADAGTFGQAQVEATTATAPQISTALAVKETNATIVWKENCDAQDAETVSTADLDPYIKTILTASLSCAADKDTLGTFNQYLDMDTAKEIWVKHGYEIAEQKPAYTA